MCSSFLGWSRDTRIACCWVYFRIPPAPWREPSPDAFAAHRQLERRVVDERVVDADRAGVDPPGDRLAARDVLGEDGGGEAVGRVVGQPDRLLGVGHLHDRQGRAEGLLAHARHRVVDVDEDGGLVPEAVGRPRWPPMRPGRPCHGVLDVPLDDLHLRRERHRADVVVPGPGRAALADPTRLLGDLGHELVVDRGLDVDALDGDAGLAGVAHRVVGGGVGGALEVGVGEDDHRVLAAELERDGRERLGGPGHDLLAGPRGAGEHDHVDLVDERGPGLAAAGGDLQTCSGRPHSRRPSASSSDVSGVTSDG